MFEPKYTITGKLLENIKRVNRLVNDLNQRRFSDVVLVELQKTAEATSAFASTSIEGNPLPLTDVKQILKTRPHNLRESEQEVVNYNEALQEINTDLKRGKISFNISLVLSIQRKVINTIFPPFQSGKLRTQPVFVNDPRLQKTVYWPPDVQDVPGLMEDLIEFVQKNKHIIDSLILAGIFHKQMVIIHPFMDGNGRASRLLTKILLAEMGLNTFNLFSFENYYNNNVTRYFEMVGERGNYYDIEKTIDFTFWLEYFTDGIIDELLRVEKLLPHVLISPQTELKSYHQKMLLHIRQKGYITDREYAKLVFRARSTRHLDFKKLISLGLIEMKGESKAAHYVVKEK
ncbi:MAG: Fic family protein [bacterium]|nr:Fic family protein [bacterium]